MEHCSIFKMQKEWKGSCHPSCNPGLAIRGLLVLSAAFAPTLCDLEQVPGSLGPLIPCVPKSGAGMMVGALLHLPVPAFLNGGSSRNHRTQQMMRVYFLTPPSMTLKEQGKS